MELWLQILIGILVVLAIFAVIYMFFAFRRISIVFKKIDYLTEDLTYKLESLSSTVEALKGFSKYITLVQSLLDSDLQNDKDNKYIQENRKKIIALSEHLRKIAEKDISKKNG